MQYRSQLGETFKIVIPKSAGDPWSVEKSEKTKVFGLGTWPFTEQHYKDVKITEKLEVCVCD